MQSQELIIDKKLLQTIITKKKFDTTFYDYFIYLFLSILIISFSGLLFYSLFYSNQALLNRLCLSLLLVIGLIYLLYLLFRSFIISFYFKKVLTNIDSDSCTNIVIEVLAQQKLPFQKSSNAGNVIICMEYFAYSKSILETTIVILDNYLLINTRNRNTSIISIHTGKLIDFFTSYFGSRNLID